MKLLHVDSSITPNSISRVVSAAIAERITATLAPMEVSYRDLVADALPHLSGCDIPPDPDTDRVTENLTILQQFLDADYVVIGAPMYNFNIPSQLKAWIDRLVLAGKTFRYTENGPVGLAGGKKVYIASSRGSFYSAGTPNTAFDHQESYLETVFRFLGVSEVVFVRAEGATSSPEARSRATEQALLDARQLEIRL